MRKIMSLLVVLALAAGGLGFWYTHKGDSGVGYRTEVVHKGDLLATVSATGTVEPEDIVDVGAQVAGQILEFGKDKNGKMIDSGSAVEPGMTLAQIDDTLYKAKVAASKAHLDSTERKVDQARAKVGSAEANVTRGDADLKLNKAKQLQSDRDWTRAQRLGPGGSLAPQEYDGYLSAFESNKANVGVSEAALVQYKAALADAKAAVKDAEAAVEEARAMLRQDEINLGYATIKSPIKGTIITRRVTLGQTVQSSFNTPSLFLLARDLKRVKVWVSVNESDIGQIHKGQDVSFTVDGLPTDTFTGKVDRIRLDAASTQNVVTYTVEVLTDNKDGKLLPYMTANVLFEAGRRQSILLVPNAALRWKPQPAMVHPDVRDDHVAALKRRKAKQGQGVPATAKDHSRGTVWVADGNFVRPLKLKVGLTDGTNTELLSGDLADGQPLVTGEQQKGGGDNVSNPFVSTPFSKKQ